MAVRIPDERLLAALECANGAFGDYVDADLVRRYLEPEDRLAITTPGLGRRLSGLAKRGECWSRFAYYQNVYQSRKAVG